MVRVLVTGASGYIAMHIVDQFLKEGHIVRGTVRSLADTSKVEPIEKLAAGAKHPLELVEAELLDSASWERAVKDCDVVVHAATPVTFSQNEDEVIKPAVQGTLNVLNASLKAKVKRVVYTSSSWTIHGNSVGDKTYSEKDWADVQ